MISGLGQDFNQWDTQSAYFLHQIKKATQLKLFSEQQQ